MPPMKNNRMKIKNIVPYNELFYKSCFYNSLFPVLVFFEKSIDDILFNDISIYAMDEEQEKMIICHLSNQSITDLAEEMGVTANTNYVADDLISHCTQAIAEGKPVILWVDCYYLSYRADTCYKQHLPHSLLLYGYEMEEEQFYCMEQSKSDVLDYRERMIPFQDVVKAHEEYLAFYINDMEFPAYLDFQLDRQGNCAARDETWYWDLTRQMFNQYKEKMQAGALSLHNFLDGLKQILNGQPNTAEGDYNFYIQMINQIINSKKIEAYKLNKMPALSKISEKCAELMTLWSFMRAKLMFLSIKMKIKSIEEINEKLDTIYVLEMECLNHYLKMEGVV